MTDRPVVLLHGLATNATRTWHETGWTALLDDAGRRWCAPDLPGHGSGTQSAEPEDYRGFEAQVLELLPDETVDAVGFSLGARTLLILAALHPHRFSRLVVAGVGANLLRTDDGSAVFAEASSPVTQHFIRLSESSGQQPGTLRALLDRPDPPRVSTEMLAKVVQPTVVVLGDHDFAGPAEPLVDALPCARLVTLRGVDHFATPKAMGFIDAALTHLDVF